MTKKIISLILLVTVLISCTPAFAAVNLSDIDASHWAYSAISELVSKGTVNGYPDGSFKPNGIVTYAEFEKMITGVWKENPTPINRQSALEMLWNYSNAPKGYKVPSAITGQMNNAEAAAWGYATGLMQGNDGFNLRPLDTLTRAEASTLIVRSTKTVTGDYSFDSSISDDIAKTMWENYKIFESAYSPDETISGDELTNAVSALGEFKHFDVKLEKVTVEDAAVLLIYGAVCRANPKSITVSNIKDITDKYGNLPQIYAAYGFENGIILPSDASAVATKRDVAILLLQIDSFIGKDGIKINKNVAEYPANYKDYAYLQEGVPVAAYSVAFDNGAKPVDYYKFVNNFSFVFETFVSEMSMKYGKDKVTFTLIPSLVSQNDKTEAILRVKCTVNGSTGYQLFGAGYENAGSEFYMDIHTGEPVMNIYIPTDIAKIGKFVCNQ